MTSAIHWEIKLGVGAGSLALGQSIDDVRMLDQYGSSAIIQDESSAVSGFESALASFGPDLGLDPSEFKDMIQDMHAESASELRVVPKSVSDPVLFLKNGILSRIVFSEGTRPTFNGLDVRAVSVRNLIEAIISSGYTGLYKGKEVIFPQAKLRLSNITLPIHAILSGRDNRVANAGDVVVEIDAGAGPSYRSYRTVNI